MRLRDRLQDVMQWAAHPRAPTVATWLGRPPVVVGPYSSLAEAERVAARAAVHHLPVTTDSGQLLGILCTCDLKRDSPNARVFACMSVPVDAVAPDTPQMEAVALLRARHRGCLPVVEAGRVVGIITRGDLRRAELLTDEDCPQCCECFTRHHVRAEVSGGLHRCRECQKVDPDGLFVDTGDVT